MKIVIAGLGKNGMTLLRSLKEDGQDVGVIDMRRESVEKAEKEYGVRGVIGNGAFTQTLEDADIKRTDLFIAATDSDELNLLCCMSAKNCGAAHTAAISKKPELLTELPYFSTLCGVDMILSPEFETAGDIFRTIHIPAALKVLSFAGGRAELANVKVCDGSEIIGKTLAAIRISSKLAVLVCAVMRDGKVIIPDGRFTVQAGDSIYITGPHGDLYSFLKLIGIPNNKVKCVLVIGGSDTALYLAGALEKSGISVTVTEKNPARCRLLSDRLGKVRVVCGDPFDGKTVTKSDISNADCVVIMSDNEEENAIAAMYAAKKGAKKIITGLSKPPLCDMLPDLGYNSAVVSAQTTLSRMAVTYSRALANTVGSSVGAVCKIADGQAEIVEFIAKPDFLHIGVPLMKLNIKTGILIAGIVRGHDVLYPNGMTSINEGDRVIIVSGNATLRKLSDIITH